jgi:hypothetical protein
LRAIHVVVSFLSSWRAKMKELGLQPGKRRAVL